MFSAALKHVVTAASTPFVNKTNLVLYLDAANLSSYPGSGTTWTDLSGSGNNATLQSGTGFSNNAITFNGSTGAYAQATVNKTGNCTFSCWAKTVSLANTPMLFANATPGHQTYPNLWFYPGGNSIVWNAFDGTVGYFGPVPSTAADGNWHHYVVVNRVGVDAILYYDGQTYGATIARDTTVNNTSYVGGIPSGYFWNGSVGLFTINNTALTASEVLANYDVQKSRFT